MSVAVDSEIAELVRARFGAATRVRRIAPLAGDASTRRYVRVWLDGPAAPPTVVVMILTDRGVAMSSEELAVLPPGSTELPYVNVHRFLEPLGVAVPALYADASVQGLLVLEDVGDLALWDAVQGADTAAVRRWLQAAIDQLLCLQLRGTAHPSAECIAFQQVFDARLFGWEFEHFIEYGLVKRLEAPVAVADLAVMRRDFAAMADFLDRQPRYLNHRDFHAWNLFVHDGRIRVLDFQDALLAPAPYDLATLLGDRDTPLVVRPDLERALVTYYGEQWAAQGGPPWDPGDLWAVYSTCALQKAFKVVGRFHYLARVKGKPAYLRYLPSTLRQIARWLAARPELTELRTALGRYFPEL
jgi:hypothetical protein